METAELTIDELAAQLRMTTRNIRAYQARGLLPPPELRGRTGYYGPSHVERLELVRKLQDEGMNLATIARVLADGSLSSMVLAQFANEDPYETSIAELDGRFHAKDPMATLHRAAQLELVELIGDDLIRVLSPAVLRRAGELVEMGIPVESQLETVAVARAATRDMAEAFVHLAVDHLLEAVTRTPQPDASALQDEVERLGVIASDVVHTLFREALTERIRAVLA